MKPKFLLAPCVCTLAALAAVALFRPPGLRAADAKADVKADAKAVAKPDAESAAAADKPIRALLVCGGCCHDYAHQKDILTKGISARANVEWTIAYDQDTGTQPPQPRLRRATTGPRASTSSSTTSARPT